MYIPHITRTLGTLTLSPQEIILLRRAESAPTSVNKEGFWQVQFNFWGTILAFVVALGIITGLLTWCLVCRGKRMQKKIAREKEKEREKEEREKVEMMDRVVGNEGGVGRNGTVRKSEISRPFAAQKGSVNEEGEFKRAGYGEEEGVWGLEKELGMTRGRDMNMDSLSRPPSYHSSRDEEKMEVARDMTGDGNGNSENAWRRIEVNGTSYMGRERGESAYLEGREIKDMYS
ncbi:hypothetical protein SBOR_1724 [Sclerotinia borealis F-4128]|uniref:Uncharacterized protein n=1 Tax=Sclerotinia borealis (strain F-4128) TaxID=1432307 RepID=W9CP99_SCLBF|nr:hypothetical protein SBOR_1724 [Sclerotinia borealis F-4128]